MQGCVWVYGFDANRGKIRKRRWRISLCIVMNAADTLNMYKEGVGCETPRSRIISLKCRTQLSDFGDNVSCLDPSSHGPYKRKHQCRKSMGATVSECANRRAAICMHRHPKYEFCRSDMQEGRGSDRWSKRRVMGIGMGLRCIVYRAEKAT